MSIHLPTPVRLLSSIGGPPPTSTQAQAVDPRSNPIADPLQGSLGLYLVICLIILALVLGVAAVLWRVHVHRRPRLVPAGSRPGVSLSNNSIVCLPDFPPSTISVNSIDSAKTLANPLQAKKPVERLGLFRMDKSSGGSTALPLWTSPDERSPALVPAIVVSRCSPAIPSQSHFSSIDTVLNTDSTANLQLPGPCFSSASERSTSASSEEATSLEDLESRNIPLELTPIRLHNSIAVVPQPEKISLKSFVKRTHRRSRPIGKENAIPLQTHLSPNTVR